MTDLYSVLGIPANATQREIMSAFRRLAKEHHPDVNGGVSSEAFIQIHKAYSVLIDPQRRAVYDRFTAPENTPSRENFRESEFYKRHFEKKERTPFQKFKDLTGGFTFVFSALLAIIFVAFAGALLIVFPLGSYFLLESLNNIPARIFIVFVLSVFYWMALYRFLMNGKLTAAFMNFKRW